MHRPLPLCRAQFRDPQQSYLRFSLALPHTHKVVVSGIFTPSKRTLFEFPPLHVKFFRSPLGSVSSSEPLVILGLG